MANQILTITPEAAMHIRLLLDKRPSYGVRIGVKTRGCNGLAYVLEYADHKNPVEEEIISEGIKVLVDPKAQLFLMGSVMDYVQEGLNAGFQFKNPNEKGRCGCGESFRV